VDPSVELFSLAITSRSPTCRSAASGTGTGTGTRFQSLYTYDQATAMLKDSQGTTYTKQ
jgi:hypothetical protein